DVHPAQVAALARDVQDVARAGGDRTLDAPVWEIGVDQHVHHAPGVLGVVADVLAADRVTHPAVCAVAARDVLGPHDAGLALTLTRGVADRALDRVLAVVGHLQVDHLDAVVRHDPTGPVAGGLREVVQHPGLVDDQVRELADLEPVVLGSDRTYLARTTRVSPSRSPAV